MNFVDYIIILGAVIGFLLGFKDGLIRKIIGLIGLIAGIAFAFEFSDNLGKMLTPIFNNDEYFAGVVSGILIFLVTILATSIVKRIVHPLDKLNRFVNQFTGGIIGVIQILFFLSAVLLVLNIFSVPSKETKDGSLLYKPVHELIPASIDLVVGHRAKATDLINFFIGGKENSEKKPTPKQN